MSFGFSVGDFLNGATLAYDLIGALSSSCGSSLEYQQLIHELEIVRLTCMEIESLRSSQQLNRSLLNALTHLVRDCNKEMEQCSASVECYRESLQPGGSGSTIADSWKKMGWSLFKPRVIRSMRDRLQLKIACMNLLLSAGGCLGCPTITQGIAVDCTEILNATQDDWSHFKIFSKIAPPSRTQATRRRYDPLYRLREEPEKFFRLGQVFAIIDTAEYDKALKSIGKTWLHRPDVDNPFVGPVSVRKLIVVRSGVSSCLCLGVHNYHGNGCTEQDHQDLHSIIFSTRDPPPPITFTVTDPETKQPVVRDERGMVNKPIKMEADHPSNMLVSASRINYTRIHQLDYKMRVKPIGQVVIESIQDLSDQFQEAVSTLRAESTPQSSLKDSEITTLIHEGDEGNNLTERSFCQYIWACCKCDNKIPTRDSDCCTDQNCRHGKCDECIVAKQSSVVCSQAKGPDGLPGPDGVFSDAKHITPPSTPLFSSPLFSSNAEKVSEVEYFAELGKAAVEESKYSFKQTKSLPQLRE